MIRPSRRRFLHQMFGVGIGVALGDDVLDALDRLAPRPVMVPGANFGSLRITNLTPGTAYHFALQYDGAAGGAVKLWARTQDGRAVEFAPGLVDVTVGGGMVEVKFNDKPMVTIGNSMPEPPRSVRLLPRSPVPVSGWRWRDGRVQG